VLSQNLPVRPASRLEEPYALELRSITKRYGSVVACRDVNLAVRRGEVHGLLGENGAGKSTLMKVLVGLVPLDGGEIRLGGRSVVVHDPVHAATLGLAMAQQHFSLVERLRVWENIALAHRGKLHRREATHAVADIAERYGLDADPEARVETLTVAQRQRVELIKCLTLRPEVLVLDEPTSVLTAAESKELFEVLRQVVDRDGLAVVLISHKLDEILQATDRVTIMRDGSVVAELATCDADAHQLARAMVGRDVLLQAEMAAVGLFDAPERSGADPATPAALAAAAVTASPDTPAEAGTETTGVTPMAGAGGAAPALCLDGVIVRTAGRPLLDGFSVTVGRGEIVGVAGVEGNGQVALGDLMSGVLPLAAGTITVAGRRVPASARALLEAGVGVIPEDRHASGVVMRMSVEENLVATELDRYRRWRFLLSRRDIRRRAEELIEAFDIQVASPVTPVSSLSGGNQQRVVVARELSREPRVLVAVQPTRGLDVGAVEYMSEQLKAAASRGVGILLVSTEIDELLAVADRLVVIHAGRNVGEMRRRDVNVERLGLLMGGHVA
jgi:simple sugar transport system ATP-binding protein